MVDRVFWLHKGSCASKGLYLPLQATNDPDSSPSPGEGWIVVAAPLRPGVLGQAVKGFNRERDVEWQRLVGAGGFDPARDRHRGR